MGAAIVRGDDLDILALPAAIRLLVLDADVGEVNLVIEVRQVVFVRPFPNLIGRAIGVAVVVVVVLVALVEPALVLALQLVVEDDAFDVRAALKETRLGLFVRPIDLKVVFQFALAPQARIERLVMVPIDVPMAFEKAATRFGQRHRLVAVPGHPRGLDQPLYAQVSQVAGARINRAAVVVAEVTTGDHSECANGRERSRFGAPQGVLAIAVANEFALWSPRQVDMTRECVSDFAIAFSVVALALGPAGIVIAVSPVPIRPLRVVTGTAAERPFVVRISVASPPSVLIPVVIAIAVARAPRSPRCGLLACRSSDSMRWRTRRPSGFRTARETFSTAV
jgi:hypothetical protein